jgi:crotonobetainyl-CoA:carnitine CoA-transferase CaiB-like acyl-CoA transferase
VIGSMTAPSAPFVNGSLRTGPDKAAPLLGADTTEIAHRMLKLDDSEIKTLTEDGVFW